MTDLAQWLADPRGATPVPAGATLPSALLSGSFDPWHAGHRLLAAVAAARLGVAVDYELSLANVDKPWLTAEAATHRVRQFTDHATVWLTTAATFAEKAGLFPGIAFVIGFDTAVRLLDVRYAGGSAAARDRVLDTLLERGNRFVIGGRVDAAGAFRTWQPEAVEDRHRGLFVALTEADFRCDVSSTALRAERADGDCG